MGAPPSGRSAGRRKAAFFDPCVLPFWFVLASHAVAYVESYGSSVGLGQLVREGHTSFLSSSINSLLLGGLALSFFRHVWEITSLQVVYLGLLGLAFGHNFLISFSSEAAAWAFAKYLVPLLVLFHGYFHRDRLPELVRGFLWLVIANDVFQCISFAAYALGLAGFASLMEGGVIRAGGLCGAVGFGPINFAAAVLAERVLKNTKAGLVFLCFALSAFTFKTWVIIIVYFSWRLLHNSRIRIAVILALFCVSLPLVVAIGSSRLDQMARSVVANAQARVDLYVVGQETARNESYRVMWESLSGGNLFGEGLGYFGGPASIRYDSPAYWNYQFSWYDTAMLMTTDTYYPHLFVEMGLLGGLLYLTMFFLPLVSRHRAMSRDNLGVYLWLLALLFWESAASFAIQDITYTMSTVLFLYGLTAVDARQCVEIGAVPEKGPLRARLHPPRRMQRVRSADHFGQR